MTIPPDPSQPEVPLDYAGPNVGCRLAPLALTSFFLGLLSLLFFYFSGIPAIILGIVAYNQINRHPQQLAGLGYARAGIITGMLLPLVLLVLLPSGRVHNHEGNRTACSANITGILKACVVYAFDNDNHLPLTLGTTSPTGLNSYDVPTGPVARSTTTDLNLLFTSSAGGFYATPNNNPVSSLWILALKGSISPKSLICKSDPYADSAGSPVQDATGHYYFAPLKTTQNSYSIAFPWNTKGPGAAPYWKTNTDSGTPLMSDMALRQAPGDNVTATGKKLNSPNHNGEGQNVGYGDCHTEWNRDATKTNFLINNDSIFHYSGYDPATSSFGSTQKQSTTGITLTDPPSTPASDVYDIYMVPQRDARGNLH